MTTLPIATIESRAWLDKAACADLNPEDFFVQAGHVIGEEVLNVCRGCPVRVECVQHAYKEELNITGGYFGGLSPGQRRQMNLTEALEYCSTDTLDRPRRTVAAEDDGDDILYT